MADRGTTRARPAPGTAEPDERTQIKIKLGHRWSGIVTDIKSGEYTWADFVEGLDDEELARGQLKDVDGTFKGRPPALVPREFGLAVQREMKRRFEEIFSVDVLEVAQQYVNLAKDQGIPAKDRAKMMQYAMERIFGVIPKEVKLTQEQPWEQVFTNVTADGTGDMPAHLRERYARYQERDGSSEKDEG